jgi:hypothetical protein
MESSFDKNHTIEENWLRIVRPKVEDTIMLDCKIDVNNSEMPIDFDEFKAEFTKFYYKD